MKRRAFSLSYDQHHVECSRQIIYVPDVALEKRWRSTSRSTLLKFDLKSFSKRHGASYQVYIGSFTDPSVREPIVDILIRESGAVTIEYAHKKQAKLIEIPTR